MNSKEIRGLCEAYVAVYDDDLRNELEAISIDEDLSFIDDLSDNELEQVFETLLINAEIDLDECFNTLDFVLTEARVTSSDDRSVGSARVTTSSERPSRVARTTERQRKVRVGRLAQAAQKAGEKLASPARGGSGTSVSSRVSQASQKVKSAAQKVKGFLGKVGRAAKAGAVAAKKEFSGEAGKEAQAKYREKKETRAKEAKASVGDAFAKGPRRSSIGNVKPGPASRSAATARRQPSTPASSERRYPTEPSGQTTLFTSPVKGKSAGADVKVPVGGQKKFGAKRDKKVKVKTRQIPLRLNKEEYDIILQSIVEDLVNEGYAYNQEHAFDIIESLSSNEFENLVESYLPEEEIETIDLYDVVMNYLLDEGYADNAESAEVIMVNMSEDWRDEILDEANKLEKYRGATERQRVGRRQARDFTDVLHPSDWDTQGEPVRQSTHQFQRGMKKPQAKTGQRGGPGKYAAMQRRKGL